jgi:hypothetical protein
VCGAEVGLRRLSIEAATPESGLSLFNALSSFRPWLEFDGDEDRCVVSVQLGSDGRTVEVLATLGEFLQARPVGTPVTLTVTKEAERTTWTRSQPQRAGTRAP